MTKKKADRSTKTKAPSRAEAKKKPVDLARAVNDSSPAEPTRADELTPPTNAARADAAAPPANPPRADAAERTWEQSRHGLRRKVGIFYDIQRLRLQTAGRTYERPDGSAIQLHELDVAILEMRAKELSRAEKAALGDVQDHLNTIPFYVQVLSDKKRYRGVGPTMAGVILSSFDIHREDTVSKMWAFAGLRPMPCKRCKACHTVAEPTDEGTFKHRWGRNDGEEGKGKRKCTNGDPIALAQTYDSGQAQKPIKGEKLNYNAWLRTKLVGVLGSILIKVGSPWRKAYDDYKHRKQSQGWGRNDGHRHQAAIRYMIKMLLVDIHREWRTFLNLPVRPPYSEEKLGHVHSGSQSARNERDQAASRVGGNGRGGVDPARDPLDDEIAAEMELLDDVRGML